MGQVVTAGLNGPLVEVGLPVSCSPTVDLTVEIEGVGAGDKPNGVLLGSVSWRARLRVHPEGR